MVTNWHAMSMVYGISGILTGSRSAICCGIEFPNFRVRHRLSSRDRSGPGPKLPKGGNPMRRKRQQNAPTPRPAGPVTLADVLTALEREGKLTATRKRDLVSAVKRVANLLGDEPAAIALDMPAISARLAAVNPVAVGITSKRLSNIRSDFLAAVKAAGLMPVNVKSRGKPVLSPAWVDLFQRLSGRRAHIGLSRLARFASARGLAPKEINDEVVGDLIAAVREGTLCPRPTVLHRQVTQIWNEAARDRALGLRPVTVPSYRSPKRIDWALLPKAFGRDRDEHLAWCSVRDPFAADARPRALAPRSLRLRRDQIHAAVTALVESGIKPSAIRSLADLVSPDHFKRILRRRLDSVSGAENTFNLALGKALIQIAHEWVKVDAQVFAELKRLIGKMPAPVMKLTDKNKRALRQFDDPAVLRRLYRLPERLWIEARREKKPNFRTLAKAQAALAVAILSYAPLRSQNLTTLEFDTHLFLREGARAISTLELPAHEVKNAMEAAYDIPPRVAKLLVEYRDRFAPKVIGHRPTRLFVNIDGTPKNQATVASLVISFVRKRAGIVLTPHQFRHLSAKVMLDAGEEYETLRQVLRHWSTRTTVGAYAGMDCRRAARRHQYLVEQALATEMPTRRSNRRHRAPLDQEATEDR
jgi:integrase